ncbi:unnamed protein product [Gongylonema pulchrum]|uniref:Elongator complex protein 2 n=1 Tax=Gongylonema pulchrum TaxID=637853 RepID=A0A183E7R0_9BILA|nr:unnamed protein product [Gongylonema pulchrum]
MWGQSARIRTIILFLDNFSACDDGILAACGGQDNVVRLWRFSASKMADEDCDEGRIRFKTIEFTSLNDKSKVTFTITIEAVLSAHDDWIFSLEWHPSKLQLMSASNDKTIIIWEPMEAASGLWLDKVRVGDVGGQAVGFFGACFSPDGSTILAYSYFGGFFSWQLQQEAGDDTSWRGIATFGGHSDAVKDISWDRTGSCLLSCSVDQTTRCYAPCREFKMICEIARPQLHGYDLNCITSVSSSCFVSGADEKILRVFTVPRSFVEALKNVSKFDPNKLFPNSEKIAERNASVPALGLSNKATDSKASGDTASTNVASLNVGKAYVGAGLPTEEQLMQDTLWPEVQKLYGHGFEVFCVACNHSGTLIASACKVSLLFDFFFIGLHGFKIQVCVPWIFSFLVVYNFNLSGPLIQASRIEHAKIMIWDSESWRRRCELQYHKLTVVQLAFSTNDQFLLSVSRDRNFAIFAQSPEGTVFADTIFCSIKKSFSTCKNTSAANVGEPLCFWRFDGRDIELMAENKYSCAVTAVDFVPEILDGRYILAVGFENGEIGIENWTRNGASSEITCLKRWPAHSQTINRLRFRPKKGLWLHDEFSGLAWELASASNDNAVKVHQLIL